MASISITRLERFFRELDKIFEEIDHSRLKRDVVNRIHNRLLGANLRTRIGIPPTPMWETGDSYRALDISEDAMTVMDYYEDIEDLMGTLIYDFTDEEIELIEDMIVDYYEFM
jgi:hypothetical protein